MPNFETMSLDELVAYKTGCKREIEAVRERARAANKVYARKLQAWHVEQAIARAGLTGLVVQPEPAKLTAKGD